MGGVHTKTPATSGGPAPLKCAECGTALDHEPYEVTINVLNTNTDFKGLIKVPVCNEDCARNYMFRFKHTLMMSNLTLGEAR